MIRALLVLEPAIYSDLGSIYTNAVSHRHGFTTAKPRQNRGGVGVFTRNRFRQKIKVVMVYKASGALRATFTILNRTMQISGQNSNRIHIDAVLLFTRQMKPYRFQNASLLASFSNRPVFANGHCRYRVNRRRNRIVFDAVISETAFL